MGSLPSGVFKSRGEGTVQPASSLRAHITNLYRRADLAPAVPIIAGISFVVHVVFGNNYGYFRDELYFMAMSHHPAFGYVDVPPLVPWITLIPLFLTGNALWALHVISALVCAGIIILTGLMARLLGGTGWVQGLAALGSATSLVLLAGGSTYTYDVFDQFWWALGQFGARYHLPPPISGHNAFYIWGPGGCTGQVLITINVAPQDAARAFGSVTLAARTSCKACVDFENNAPILILRDPKEPFSVLWAQAKMYE
jgi:hypothetical protein